MRLIDVTLGVKWVDIEEAGLRILCGCPADIIKHLMRRGLVIETEVDGTLCETGPNAILVSDLMLQGSAFANLAEFPVLQMLYKQGYIIPNHPNNTGEKPALLGLSQQLDAQLNYIYRGNYGLTSVDELKAAGLSDEAADEIMRIKLYFAFGSIKTPEELIDCIPAAAEPVEIRNGVSYRRIGLNRYQFLYKSQHLDVDLNLSDGETYASPYPLGMHQVSRDYFSVVHSGEGDGWDIDRPCMGGIISFQGKLYLTDAGPNLDAIFQSLSISVNEIEGIFQTHSHDDHFAGFPTLLQADHKLRYYSVPAVRHSVTKKLSALISINEDEFSNFFDVVDLESEVWNDVDGLEVKPMLSPHPVETTVLKFRTLGPGGYKTYFHLADITSDRVLENMVTDDAGKPGISRAQYDRFRENYQEPADLKKIDIGGGMIHGESEDFENDKSEKIIFAHVARPLTTVEKQVGSGADFGTTDILIKSSQEYLRRHAYLYVTALFPDLPISRLEILLNNEVRIYNPHEIFVRKGEPINELQLILSGNAESIIAETSDSYRLGAGDLLGEYPLLKGSPAITTYRATSVLTALVIPSSLYQNFIDDFDQRESVLDLAEKRAWLRRTPIFRQGISSQVLNGIARKMYPTTLEDGETVHYNDDKPSLRFVDQGVLKRLIGEKEVDTLRDGDFFNEEQFQRVNKPESRLESSGPSKLWDIPLSVVSDIPIVRWRIMEILNKRALVENDATRSST